MTAMTLSSKNQVVVPKLVRKRLKLQSGQRLYVEKMTDTTVVFTTLSAVDKYYGALSGFFKEDAVSYQKRLRVDD
jgi:AbrB family looped-hinge helix DNA binding protein